MKRIKQVLAIAGSTLVIASCQNPDQRDDNRIEKENATATSQRYVDPNTGAPVDLYYNAHEKMTYDRATDKPVQFYVNTNTGDTVYGRGRYVVNGYIIRGEDGLFRLDDAKVEVDDDEIKIKGENGKLKIDDDEIKYKDDDVKLKKENGEAEKVKEN
jgi:hypothetical protein